MPYEWDDDKAELNERNHGVTFEEAAELLEGDCVAFAANTKNERRYKAIARSAGEYFAIIYTTRGGNTRIISARHAEKKEGDTFEKHFR